MRQTWLLLLLLYVYRSLHVLHLSDQFIEEPTILGWFWAVIPNTVLTSPARDTPMWEWRVYASRGQVIHARLHVWDHSVISNSWKNISHRSTRRNTGSCLIMSYTLCPTSPVLSTSFGNYSAPCRRQNQGKALLQCSYAVPQVLLPLRITSAGWSASSEAFPVYKCLHVQPTLRVTHN